MEFRLSAYGLDAWRRGLERAPAMAQREMLAAAEEATMLLDYDVKQLGHYPRDTGLTQDGISRVAFSTPAGVLGLVGSPSPVAAFLELGTRRMAARAPFAALLARKQHEVERIFESAAGRIAKNLAELPGGTA